MNGIQGPRAQPIPGKRGHHQDGHRRPPAVRGLERPYPAAPPGQRVADRRLPLAEHVRPRWPTTTSRILDPASLRRPLSQTSVCTDRLSPGSLHRAASVDDRARAARADAPTRVDLHVAGEARLLGIGVAAVSGRHASDADRERDVRVHRNVPDPGGHRRPNSCVRTELREGLTRPVRTIEEAAEQAREGAARCLGSSWDPRAGNACCRTASRFVVSCAPMTSRSLTRTTTTSKRSSLAPTERRVFTHDSAASVRGPPTVTPPVSRSLSRVVHAAVSHRPARSIARRRPSNGTPRALASVRDAGARTPQSTALAPDEIRSSASAVPRPSLRPGEAEASPSCVGAARCSSAAGAPRTGTRAVAPGRKGVRGSRSGARAPRRP